MKLVNKNAQEINGNRQKVVVGYEVDVVKMTACILVESSGILQLK